MHIHRLPPENKFSIKFGTHGVLLEKYVFCNFFVLQKTDFCLHSSSIQKIWHEKTFYYYKTKTKRCTPAVTSSLKKLRCFFACCSSWLLLQNELIKIFKLANFFCKFHIIIICTLWLWSCDTASHAIGKTTNLAPWRNGSKKDSIQTVT
jgi:hypothetical protein